MFKRIKARVLDLIEDKWQGRFKHGALFIGMTGSINRFSNGEYKICFTLGQLISSNSGHWPASLFDIAYITGERNSFHICVLGLMYGFFWMSDLDEEGKIVGADYKKHYRMFSCINHFNQQLEEIVYNAK